MMNIKKNITVFFVLLLVIGCSNNEVEDSKIEGEQLSKEVQKQLAEKKILINDGVVYLRRFDRNQHIEMLINAGSGNVDFEFALSPLKQNNEEGLLPATKEENKNKTNQIAGDYFVRAQSYFLNKEYKSALVEINRSIKEDSQSSLAWALKGSIHYKRKENALARRAWKRTIQLNPEFDRVKEMLAIIGD